MESAEKISSRMTELEIKLGYAEDQLEAINLSIYRQQQLIDQLLREFKAMRVQMANNTPGESLSLRDELPPHY